MKIEQRFKSKPPVVVSDVGRMTITLSDGTELTIHEPRAGMLLVSLDRPISPGFRISPLASNQILLMSNER